MDLPVPVVPFHRYSATTAWLAQRPLSLTTQVQYDNFTERLGLFTHLRWVLRPGSDLYLVYTHNWHRLDRSHLSPQNADPTAKLTYTVQR